MTKDKALAFIEEKCKAYGNMLCYLRNMNKQQKHVEEIKEVFTVYHSILKETPDIVHPYDLKHLKYYLKTWYGLEL